MKILEVPKELQIPTHDWAHTGSKTPTVEQYVHEYMVTHAHMIRTDWIYLPIYWTNNYCHHKLPDGFLRAFSKAQTFVSNRLDTRKRYFTVVQCDDGIYEKLPKNVLVFGAGGKGDIPIPLVHPLPWPKQQFPKTYTANFIGTRNQGTSVYDKKSHAPYSSWNPRGIASKIRDAMFKECAGRKDYYLLDGRTPAYAEIVQRSIFTLAPRGYGKTSYRLYEAMQLGSIPVYISDEFWLPFVHEVNWREFCILCEVDDIPRLSRTLAKVSPEWIKQAMEIIPKLVSRYFSPHGSCRQIRAIIEGLT